MNANTNVLVIGLDACERGIALRLAREGSMPNLAALMERGAHGRIVNPPGLFVGAVWPTLYTGVGPAEHGRYCFLQFDPAGYAMRHTSPATDVHARPFWEALSDAGRRVAVFDVPHTGLSPEVNGVMVVDWGAHDGKVGHTTAPAELADDLTARFGKHPVGASCNGDRATAEDYRPLVDNLLAATEMRAGMARHYLGWGGWDVFTYVFSEAHCVGHQCWHLHDADHPRYLPSVTSGVGGDPVVRVYEALDRALGEVVEAAGPDATTVLVLSHGMGPRYGGNHVLDEVLRRIDIVSGSTPRRAAMAVADAALDLLPDRLRQSVLWRLGAHASQRWQGEVGKRPRLLLNKGSNRRFYAVPNNDTCGAICLNVKGLRPKGTIPPGEVRHWIELLRRELLALRNLETGEPVVRDVVEVADHYDGPALGSLPDLYVEWNSARPIERVASPLIGEVHVPDTDPRSGDHRPAGQLVIAGPGVAAGHLEPVAATDVAPTICALVGVPLAASTGSPLAGVPVPVG